MIELYHMYNNNIRKNSPCIIWTLIYIRFNIIIIFFLLLLLFVKNTSDLEYRFFPAENFDNYTMYFLNPQFHIRFVIPFLESLMWIEDS